MDFWQVSAVDMVSLAQTWLSVIVACYRQGPFYPNASTPYNISLEHNYFCGELGGPLSDHCLFQIFDDRELTSERAASPHARTVLAASRLITATEHVDQSASYPDVVKAMLSRIDELDQTIFKPHRGTAGNASCIARQLRSWRVYWAVPALTAPGLPL